MEDTLAFTLSYEGNRSDRHQIDFYDISQALIGFQRSLALTTHLVLNGEIITQAPSLKGAHIYALPPEEGSWKWVAIVTCVGHLLYQAGTAPRDTPLGNLVASAYDLLISESLGFHVDFDRTLGAQYEEYKRHHPEAKPLTQHKIDSLVEKCELAVKQIHRPLIESQTAEVAKISALVDRTPKPIGNIITPDTYDYLQYTIKSDHPLRFSGRVSGYNMNTYKGRIYLTEAYRPVPFVLSEQVRTKKNIRAITRSLSLNANNPDDPSAEISFLAYSFTSRTDRLKWLLITDFEERR